TERAVTDSDTSLPNLFLFLFRQKQTVRPQEPRSQHAFLFQEFIRPFLIPGKVRIDFPRIFVHMCLNRRLLFFCPLSRQDRKSTRLNSSHVSRSYAVFC